MAKGEVRIKTLEEFAAEDRRHGGDADTANYHIDQVRAEQQAQANAQESGADELTAESPPNGETGQEQAEEESQAAETPSAKNVGRWRGFLDKADNFIRQRLAKVGENPGIAEQAGEIAAEAQAGQAQAEKLDGDRTKLAAVAVERARNFEQQKLALVDAMVPGVDILIIGGDSFLARPDGSFLDIGSVRLGEKGEDGVKKVESQQLLSKDELKDKIKAALRRGRGNAVFMRKRESDKKPEQQAEVSAEQKMLLELMNQIKAGQQVIRLANGRQYGKKTNSDFIRVGGAVTEILNPNDFLILLQQETAAGRTPVLLDKPQVSQPIRLDPIAPRPAAEKPAPQEVKNETADHSAAAEIAPNQSEAVVAEASQEIPVETEPEQEIIEFSDNDLKLLIGVLQRANPLATGNEAFRKALESGSYDKQTAENGLKAVDRLKGMNLSPVWNDRLGRLENKFKLQIANFEKNEQAVKEQFEVQLQEVAVGIEKVSQVLDSVPEAAKPGLEAAIAALKAREDKIKADQVKAAQANGPQPPLVQVAPPSKPKSTEKPPEKPIEQKKPVEQAPVSENKDSILDLPPEGERRPIDPEDNPLRLEDEGKPENKTDKPKASQPNQTADSNPRRTQAKIFRRQDKTLTPISRPAETAKSAPERAKEAPKPVDKEKAPAEAPVEKVESAPIPEYEKNFAKAKQEIEDLAAGYDPEKGYPNIVGRSREVPKISELFKQLADYGKEINNISTRDSVTNRIDRQVLAMVNSKREELRRANEQLVLIEEDRYNKREARLKKLPDIKKSLEDMDQEAGKLQIEIAQAKKENQTDKVQELTQSFDKLRVLYEDIEDQFNI